MQPPSSPPDTTLPPPGTPARTDGPYLPPAQPRLATPTLPPSVRSTSVAALPAPPVLSPPTAPPTTPAVGVPSVATLEALVSFDTELHVHAAPPPQLLTAPPTSAPEEKPVALTTVIPSVTIPPVTPISLGGAAPIKLFDPAAVPSSDGDEEVPVPSATMPSYKAWLAEQQNGPKARKRPVSGKGSRSLGSKVVTVVVIGVIAAVALFAWRQLAGGDTPAPTPGAPAAVSTTVAGG